MNIWVEIWIGIELVKSCLSWTVYIVPVITFECLLVKQCAIGTQEGCSSRSVSAIVANSVDLTSRFDVYVHSWLERHVSAKEVGGGNIGVNRKINAWYTLVPIGVMVTMMRIVMTMMRIVRRRRSIGGFRVIWVRMIKVVRIVVCWFTEVWFSTRSFRRSVSRLRGSIAGFGMRSRWSIAGFGMWSRFMIGWLGWGIGRRFGGMIWSGFGWVIWGRCWRVVRCRFGCMVRCRCRWMVRFRCMIRFDFRSNIGSRCRRTVRSRLMVSRCRCNIGCRFVVNRCGFFVKRKCECVRGRRDIRLRFMISSWGRWWDVRSRCRWAVGGWCGWGVGRRLVVSSMVGSTIWIYM